MSEVPSELKYAPTHEWVLRDDDEQIVIGITDFAQKSLGEIVFVELPEVGEEVFCGKEFGVVESVNAASDLYSPMSGEVMAINQKLIANPDLINTDPYHEGWLIKIMPHDSGEWEDLLDADDYAEKVKA